MALPAEFKTTSKKMLRICSQMEKAAKTSAAILVTGERGVGKGLCAKYIHNSSTRASGPFIDVAASYASTLQLPDLIKSAKGGTLYINEISELDLKWQRKLLSAIISNKSAYFRLISSSTLPLEPLIKQGDFLEELYYAISVVKIRLLPLRERREDIPQLIETFVQRCRDESGKEKTVSAEVMQMLCGRSWPGNADELESLVQYAFQNSKVAVIQTRDLPEWSTASYYTSCSGESLTDELNRIAGELLQSAEQMGGINVMEDFNKIVMPPLLKASMEYTGSNISKAARLLGITRNTLKKNLRDYNIEKE